MAGTFVSERNLEFMLFDVFDLESLTVHPDSYPSCDLRVRNPPEPPDPAAMTHREPLQGRTERDQEAETALPC